MNQNDLILRLAFKYSNSKGNSSGFYRDWSFIFEKRGPYKDGGL